MVLVVALAFGAVAGPGVARVCQVVEDRSASLACVRALLPELVITEDRAYFGAHSGAVRPDGTVVLDVGEGAIWLIGSEWGVVGGRWVGGARGEAEDLSAILGRPSITDPVLVGAAVGALAAGAAGMSASLVGGGTIGDWSDRVAIPEGGFALVGSIDSGVPVWWVVAPSGPGGALVVPGDDVVAPALAAALRAAVPAPVSVSRSRGRLLVLWGSMAETAVSPSDWRGSPPPSVGWDTNGWFRSAYAVTRADHYPADAWSLEAVAVVNDARAAVGSGPVVRDTAGSIELMATCAVDGTLPTSHGLWSAGPDVLQVVLDPGVTELAVCVGGTGWLTRGAPTSPLRGLMSGVGPTEVWVGRADVPDAHVANAAMYPPDGWWPESYLLAWFPRDVAGPLTWSWSGGASGTMSGDGRRFAAAVPLPVDVGAWRVEGSVAVASVRAPIVVSGGGAPVDASCGADDALDWLAARVGEGWSLEAARLLVAGVLLAGTHEVTPGDRVGCVGDAPELVVRGHGPRSPA